MGSTTINANDDRKKTIYDKVLVFFLFLFNFPDFLNNCFSDIRTIPLHKFFACMFYSLVRIFPLHLRYEIEHQIVTSTTKIIFTRSKRTHEKICFKIRLPYKNEVYNTFSLTRRNNQLVESLLFHDTFAPGIHLGIASIKYGRNPKEILRGGLIKINNLNRDSIKKGMQYVLVMKYLEEEWSLDYQLRQGIFDTKEDMNFLAEQVAAMHKDLRLSPDVLRFGAPDSIAAKLQLNKRCFDIALRKLSGIPMEHYKCITTVLEQSCKNNVEHFVQRQKEGCIKRCHGDLKAANIWIRPEGLSSLAQVVHRQMLALDCIDFNPALCHIDTLSDVALLAIDVELWLEKTSRQNGWSATTYFLNSYLREVGEQDNVWPLLEYYMTEKCMVMAYVAIIYNDNATLSKRYLDLALAHTRKLERLALHV